MAKLKVNEENKPLVKLFNSFKGGRSLWEVFNDCIECYAISIQNIFCLGERFAANEKRYSEIMEKYSLDERLLISRIFQTITDMLERNPFQDLLGDLYMRLDMGNSALGQFFTPYNVSKLLANVNVPDELIKSDIEKHGYIVINEPTVGGGANIIAFCERLYLSKINYQKHLVVICQELNRLTALMCYVVLTLLGCSAIIKVGDTLKDPYTRYWDEVKKGSELWTTPMFHINNCYDKV